ncbi:hypothetical protein TNCV_24151 [Trichonephila clavipes]|nr:hypothetical protein TNCV_24151 [Trichonephila clavipes]
MVETRIETNFECQSDQNDISNRELTHLLASGGGPSNPFYRPFLDVIRHLLHVLPLPCSEDEFGLRLVEENHSSGCPPYLDYLLPGRVTSSNHGDLMIG